MAGLHTWAGLLPGWLLFVVFLFGSAAFFQQEISAWMRPELQGRTATPQALDRATVLLAQRAPEAAQWTIALPSPRGGDPLALSWEHVGTEGVPGSATLDPATGHEIAPRATRGGSFLFSFHYNLYYMPWQVARYLVSAAALAMLAALVSGIVIHARIFKDFFTLRLGRGQRSWLDAHNVVGVLALPFHLMITYTGLATLYFMIMPWPILTLFPDRAAFREASQPAAAASAQSDAALPLPQLLARAETRLGETGVSYLILRNPGHADASVEVWPRQGRLGARHEPLRLDPATGDVLPGPIRGSATATLEVMTDLHTGRFADPALRWLYALSGLAGTAMIASGLVLWTAKRRARSAGTLGFAIVERLNVAVIAGAPAGIAGYFLANRLLPPDLVGRAEWEIHALFLTWLALTACTLVRPMGFTWCKGLAVAAALYALVPLVNAITTDRGLIASLIAGDAVFAGFDAAMLAIAATCALAAGMARTSPGVIRKEAIA